MCTDELQLTMFFAAGAPALMPSNPLGCKFLTDRERHIAHERLIREHRAVGLPDGFGTITELTSIGSDGEGPMASYQSRNLQCQQQYRCCWVLPDQYHGAGALHFLTDYSGGSRLDCDKGATLLSSAVCCSLSCGNLDCIHIRQGSEARYFPRACDIPSHCWLFDPEMEHKFFDPIHGCVFHHNGCIPWWAWVLVVGHQ